MKMYRLVTIIATLALVSLGKPADANPITYNFWLNAPNGYPVTDLVLYAADASQHNVFLSPVELAPSGVFQLTHPLGFEPTDALVVGITERDKDNWWDIVVFTSEAYAVSAVGLRYSELFLSSNPGYLGHNELTPLMQAAHNGDSSALDAVTAFLRGPDASAAYFDPRGPFSIIQFSEVLPPIGGIPEPAALALLGLGLAGISYKRRRKPVS